MGKPSIADVRALKSKGLNSFVAVSAVNYWQALCAAEAGVDVLNISDVAVSRLLLGRLAGFDYSTTMEEMIIATKAVKQGSGDCLVIPSIPYGYYNSPAESVAAATRIMKETGADALHMEDAHADCVKAVCDAGWPVLAAAGMTKRYFTSTGSTKIRGRTQEDAQELLDYCVAMEKAGAFSITLEGIPAQLSKIITEKLGICTCGIGAGKYCNGQFLVMDDVLGISDFKPKYVKHFADLRNYMINGVKAFVDDVASGAFPDDEHSYNLKDYSYLDNVK